jgi:hypothetical protein
MMTTVRVSLVKSNDSNYHIHRVRFSRANNPALAKDLANRIQFDVQQSDSYLYLPQGFAITPAEKFRNQQVLIVVEVPVGKRIVVDRNVDDYHWFSIDVNRRHSHWNLEFSDDWNDSYSWSSNVEYIMTDHGLERTDKTSSGSDDNEDDHAGNPVHKGYRYKPNADSNDMKKKTDSVSPKSRTRGNERAIRNAETGKSAMERKITEPIEGEIMLYPILKSFFS